MIWSILPDTKAMMLMIMIRHKYIQILYHRSSHFFVHSQNWNVRHSRNSRSLQPLHRFTYQRYFDNSVAFTVRPTRDQKAFSFKELSRCGLKRTGAPSPWVLPLCPCCLHPSRHTTSYTLALTAILTGPIRLWNTVLY